MGSEKVECITKTFENSVAIYISIKDQTPPGVSDVNTLRKLYTSMKVAISEYSAQCEKVGIPKEESYLTKWFVQSPYQEYDELIEQFLAAN